VATALLLVVAVVAVVSFSGWFSTFSSQVFVDVEGETIASGTVSVEGLFGNKLYLNSKRQLFRCSKYDSYKQSYP
jgi:hypothetical protein